DFVTGGVFHAPPVLVLKTVCQSKATLVALLITPIAFPHASVFISTPHAVVRLPVFDYSDNLGMTDQRTVRKP
ncbi:MAG: hypothetical protein ACPL7O_07795, partial [Armatimonadota bacterium]